MVPVIQMLRIQGEAGLPFWGLIDYGNVDIALLDLENITYLQGQHPQILEKWRGVESRML